MNLFGSINLIKKIIISIFYYHFQIIYFIGKIISQASFLGKKNILSKLLINHKVIKSQINHLTKILLHSGHLMKSDNKISNINFDCSHFVASSNFNV